MKFEKRTLATTLAASTVLGMAGPAWADGGEVAAGLFGGMLLGRAIQQNRQVEQSSAYQSGYSAGSYSAPPPQTVYIEQPESSGGSAEQRLRELTALHDKGMISDKEYATRRKAILDSI